MRLTSSGDQGASLGGQRRVLRVDKAQHEIEKLGKARIEERERERDPGGVGTAEGGRGCVCALHKSERRGAGGRDQQLQ